MSKQWLTAGLWLAMFVVMDSMGAALVGAPSGWGAILGVLSAVYFLADIKRFVHPSGSQAVRSI
jgi:uncharacterized protein (DUF58 family)